MLETAHLSCVHTGLFHRRSLLFCLIMEITCWCNLNAGQRYTWTLLPRSHRAWADEPTQEQRHFFIDMVVKRIVTLLGNEYLIQMCVANVAARTCAFYPVSKCETGNLFTTPLYHGSVELVRSRSQERFSRKLHKQRHGPEGGYILTSILSVLSTLAHLINWKAPCISK